MPQVLSWFVPLALLSGPGLAAGAARPAAEILAEIDKVPVPARPSREGLKDKTIVADFLAKLDEASQRKAVLVRELWSTDPDNDRLPKLLGAAWSYRIEKATDRRNASMRALSREGADKKRLLEEAALPWFAGLGDEMDGVLAATKNEQVKIEAAYWRAELAIARAVEDRGAAAVLAIEGFIALAPNDQRGGGLLFEVARVTHDPKKQAALCTRLIADYPACGLVPEAERLLTNLAGVGKPLELEFNDAITGARVAMKDLRGQIVVVEFWATWCGPCVEGIPKMKELYARYRDRGVEFIGVSLDEAPDKGGLEKLKACVAENKMPWPQYYLNDGSPKQESLLNFVNGVPTILVVDQEGRLASVQARGNVEAMIQQLLKRGRGEPQSKAGPRR